MNQPQIIRGMGDGALGEPVVAQNGAIMRNPNYGKHIEFYTKAVYNKARSLEEKKDRFDDVLYIRIRTSGRNSIVDRPVTKSDRANYRHEIEAFEKTQEQPVNGFPIQEFPLLMKSQVAELKAFNIVTVEQLAAMPDAACSSFGNGGRALREKAKAWLKEREDAGELGRYAELNEKLTEENKHLQGQIDELKALVEKLAGEEKEPTSKSKGKAKA